MKNKTRQIVREELLRENVGYDLKGIATEISDYVINAFGNDFDKRHFIENLTSEFQVDIEDAEDMFDSLLDELLSEKTILKMLKRDY